MSISAGADAAHGAAAGLVAPRGAHMRAPPQLDPKLARIAEAIAAEHKRVGGDLAEVKQAVESLFKVKVVDVRTSIVRGKRRRIGRSEGMRPNWKKAIVTLKEGDAISIFEGK